MALKTAGDIVWESCILVNSEKTPIDFLTAISELNIYEDVFSYYLTGEALIVDTKNLIDTFPILGQEELYVKFKTPSADDTNHVFEKRFRVTGVKNREIHGNKQTYVIELMSHEAYTEQTYKETRAHHGTGDIIAKRVWSVLQAKVDEITFTPQVEKTKLIIDEPSPLNEMKFVSPYWSAFKCITYAASNSLSSYNIADYMFYESRTGFHMKSMTKMFVEDPIDYFTYDVSVAADNSLENQMKGIQSMIFPVSSDQLQRILFRAYGGTSITHDLLTKRLKWEPSYPAIPSMNGHEPYIANEFRFSPSYNIRTNNSYSYNHDEIVNDGQGTVDTTRVLTQNRFEFMKLHIEVWGRTWIEVGKTVYIDFGKADESQNKKDPVNPFTSGKYLVTAIKHRLAPSQHKMTVEVIKESSLEKIVAMKG